MSQWLERKLWRKMSKHLPGSSWRLEVTTAAGIPDVLNVHQGITTFIELKATNRSFLYLRKQQHVWFATYNARGGNTAYLVVNHGDMFYAVPAAGVVDLVDQLGSNSTKYHMLSMNDIKSFSITGASSMTEFIKDFGVSVGWKE